VVLFLMRPPFADTTVVSERMIFAWFFRFALPFFGPPFFCCRMEMTFPSSGTRRAPQPADAS